MGVSVLFPALRPVLKAVAAMEVLSGHFWGNVLEALENGMPTYIQQRGRGRGEGRGPEG